MLYTMLTRGRVENHAHIVLDADASHALPSPVLGRALTATEASGCERHVSWNVSSIWVQSKHEVD